MVPRPHPRDRRCRGRGARERPAGRPTTGLRRAQDDGLHRRPPGHADRPPRRTSAAPAATWASPPSSSASTPAPPSSRRRRPTCTRPTNPRRWARSNARPAPPTRKKVVILGGGPNRIGQGIEFDYCCCHACFALTDAGYETIMVNCNPETVSTDYDTSDRLYFEPLTLEHVLEILRVEQDERHAARRDRAVRRPDAAEARQCARGRGHPDPRHLARCHRPCRGPRAVPASSEPARASSSRTTASPLRAGGQARSRTSVGYPLVIRPSYVLGGRAMEIVRDDAHLDRYIARRGRRLGRAARCCWTATSPARSRSTSTRCATARDVHVAGIMQHIEEAGRAFRRQRLLAAALLAARRDRRRAEAPDRGAGARR